jgi:hypothetical protein
MSLFFSSSHERNDCSDGLSKRDVGIACAAEVRFEVALELEHVSKVLGPRKTQRPKRLWADGVVAHVLIQNLTQRNRHLFSGEVLPSDADGLADQLSTLFEESVSAAANILRGDPGQLLLVHREREDEFPVGRTLRSHALKTSLLTCV